MDSLKVVRLLSAIEDDAYRVANESVGQPQLAKVCGHAVEILDAVAAMRYELGFLSGPSASQDFPASTSPNVGDRNLLAGTITKLEHVEELLETALLKEAK